ncbi:MAG: HAD-IIA family hydrolase [Lachnospiraceae bacterium]|nr:HAD-IIA family hydrolase [Lachnospiraceae bacterium]
MDLEDIKDVWGKEVTELLKKKLFLFDMDGTIYEEERVFDGTRELLALINRIHGRYVFITNNSSRSVEDHMEKVKGLGIKADIDNFFTSSQATILYLKKYYPEHKVYCQGTRSLVQELISSGLNVTEDVEDDVEILLVGFDTELTSRKLRNTCELLQKDIPFIATNPDMRCPVSFGFIPDCGAICNMLGAATDKKPIYIGKPEPTMVNIVMDKYGFSAEETVVIGDRLYTDIATGLNAGVTTVCVLTGEATKEDIQKGKIKPTLTFESVKDIVTILKKYRGM